MSKEITFENGKFVYDKLLGDYSEVMTHFRAGENDSILFYVLFNKKNGFYIADSDNIIDKKLHETTATEKLIDSLIKTIPLYKYGINTETDEIEDCLTLPCPQCKFKGVTYCERALEKYLRETLSPKGEENE